ncbi:hypothetical protein BDZ97DRAFT_1414990 [Flammula alnicola]|nr:hypothetical protein BDZ97DRAFT_1414990 [Flammula alnicola]
MLWDNHNYEATASRQWDTLFPRNKGRISLDDSGRQFQVAMYSHLECVNKIRLALVEARDLLKGTSLTPTSPPFQAREEIDACFGQIRQAVLCAGDFTTNPTVLTFTNDSLEKFDIDTVEVGTYHRCRDWTANFESASLEYYGI